jgi:ABC-type spermidine/putrescine transport system permease subunit II
LRKLKSAGAKIYLVLVLLLMYLPVIAVAVYSFNGNTGRLPNAWMGFSTIHYQNRVHTEPKLLVDIKACIRKRLCGKPYSLLTNSYR